MELNEEQKAASQAEGKSIYVRSVPGSGKTEMLIARVEHLIQEKGFAPHDILCCTFTRMAAQEIQRRLADRIGSPAMKICAGTIHSIALDTLQNAQEGKYSIVTASEEEMLFQHAAVESGIMRGVPASKWSVPKQKCKAALEEYYQTGDRATRFSDGYLFFETFLNICNRNRLLTFGMILPKLREELARYAGYLRFRHILIDEVQDIDLIQWRLFAALQSLGDADLFAVGDPNQSVFGFRGSLPDYPEVNAHRFQFFDMKTNYRSATAIVNAANRLIAHNGSRQKMEPARSYPGEVVFGGGKDSRETASFVADLLTFTDWKEQDIAVLARNHVFLERIRQELCKLNVPCVYHAADNMEKLPGFLQMINLMKLLVNPHDNFAFMQVKDLLCDDDGMDYLHIACLSEERGDSFFQVWRDRTAWSDKRYAQHFFDLYGNLPLPEQQCAAVAFALQELGDIPQEALAIPFQWCVTARCRNSVKDFLDWLALRENDQDKTGGTAVHLLTIHAAKGLQWPVVVVAGVNEGILPSAHAVREGEKAIEEERRLMYVALTRAMDQANILSRPEWSEKYHNPVSRFVKEMAE